MDMIRSSIPKAEWTDDRHAPVVFFESAPACQFRNGLVGVTLSVDLARTIDASAITVKHTVIAYLRTSVQGAIELRDSLNKVILIGTPTQGSAG